MPGAYGPSARDRQGPSTPASRANGQGGAGQLKRRDSSDLKKKDSCLEQIRLLQKKREERRKSIEDKRAERAAEEKRLQDAGIPGDVDFQKMIRQYREESGWAAHLHIPPGEVKICISVRKRPLNDKEKKRKDHDAITCLNPVVMVHDCKLRVDGITKYLDNTDFAFDHTFHEDDSTDMVYKYTAAPLVPFVVKQGRATCFAYGQTGSGKTHTMQGIQQNAVRDLFRLLSASPESDMQVLVSFFEIYGGRCQDLLNNRERLVVREDGKGDVVVGGLLEIEARTQEDLMALIDQGNRNRTTHATEVNDVSSRSHAICQIVLRNRDSGRLHGKLSLVDLAGSERGADTKSHNRQRRLESAEINKSLLALKECIRALDCDSTHVPFRASKLTLVLKDSFQRHKSRTVMIATVSPGASAADHTLNTLRYADRVKEKNVGDVGPGPGGDNGPQLLGRDGPLPGPGGEDEDELLVDEEVDDDVQLEEDESMAKLDADGANYDDGDGVEEPSPPTPEPARRMSVGSLKPVPPPQEPEASNGSRPAAGGSGHANRGRGSANVASRNRSSSTGSASGRRGSRLSGGRRLKAEVRGGRGLAGLGKGVPRAAAAAGRVNKEPEDDIDYLRESLRKSGEPSIDPDEVAELHRAVQSVWDEQEALLELHMSAIQENAELLTEEGRLLHHVQGVDVNDEDVDTYASRLEEILNRKADLIGQLKRRLTNFRQKLSEEEERSKRVVALPRY